MNNNRQNNNNMKRGRNQRRRQGVNINRALDSNGPDVRIRGTANQIYDKYLALARDASSSGDRVKAENYLQHAEHYFRVIRAMQPTMPPPSDQIDNDGDQPSLGDSNDRGQRRDGDEQQGYEREDRDDQDDNDDDQPRLPDHIANGGGQNEGHRDAPRHPRADDQEARRGRRRRPRRPLQGGAEDGEGGEREGQPAPVVDVVS